MLFTSAIVFLDDVLLLSRKFQQHIGRLRMVFDKVRQAKLRMNGIKCPFAVREVKYLGHILSGKGISVDPAKPMLL